MAGRPLGSQNKDKPFREALRMEAALAEQGEPTPAPKGSLRWIARNMLERAGDDNPTAVSVADRLDGKPPQSLENTDEPFRVAVDTVVRTIVDSNQHSDSAGVQAPVGPGPL